MSYQKGIQYGLLDLLSRSDYALAPRRLSIEITDDCNLNCPMCPRRFTKITSENISLSKFKYILDQLPAVKHITLLGRGETLMNPDIFAMLELGKQRGIYFTIVTNGTLLTEKIINKLTNVSRVVVSIDHPRSEGYKRVRGVELGVIINNLKRLKQLRKKIYLCVQSLIMEDNINNLPEFISLAKGVKADEVTLIHLISFDKNLEKKYGSNFKQLDGVLRETKEIAKKEKIKLIATPLLQEPRRCYEPWLSPRISLWGDVYPCCYIYNSAELIWKECYQGICFDVPQHQYRMGNIFKSSFKDIWNGKDYRLLRRIVRQSKEHNLLSPEELSAKRNKNNLNEKFSYCRTCLWRQNRAC